MAASIELVVAAGAIDFVPGGGIPVQGVDNQTTTVDTVADGQDSASSQANQSDSGFFGGEFQSGQTTATASGDIVAGELKASVTTAYQGHLGQNAASGSGTVELSETFDVLGTGQVTFLLGFDGEVDLATTDFGGGAPSPSFQAIAELEILRGTPQRRVDGFNAATEITCTTVPCTSLSDSFSTVLEVSSFINAATTPTITVTAFVLAQILTGAGSVDISQTGKLFMSTDSTLMLDPLDQNFLENPSFGVAAVPLPAAFPLFGTGLGLLGFLGWRRRRQAQAV